jgi:protein CMS1
VQFLEQYTDSPGLLKTSSEENGSPHTIIVAGAGQRAADIVR